MPNENTGRTGSIRLPNQGRQRPIKCLAGSSNFFIDRKNVELTKNTDSLSTDNLQLQPDENLFILPLSANNVRLDTRHFHYKE